MSDDIMAFLDAKFGKKDDKKKKPKASQPAMKQSKKIDNILTSSLKDF